MPNVTTARPQPLASAAPNLPASLQRVLADPYSPGTEITSWEQPAVPPESSQLRAAVAELERGLQAAPDTHVDWCLAKLFALPSRAASTEASAYAADNFLDVAGHYPADLWTWATTEILRTKKFRPAPSELVELVEPRFAERKRMLARARSLLEPVRKALPAGEKPIATRLGRLEHLRATYARLRRMADVERLDHEIAVEKGEAAPPDRGAVIERESENRGPFKPRDDVKTQRMRDLAAAFRAKQEAERAAKAASKYAAE